MKQSKLKSWFKHGFFILVFLILPMAVCLEITEEFFEQKQSLYLEKSNKILENKLLKTQVSLKSQAYLRTLSEEAFQALSGDLSKDEINQYCKALQERVTVPFDLYLFNKGKLVSPSFIKLKSRFVGTRIWDILNLTDKKRVDTYLKHQKLIENLLGKNISFPRLAENEGILIPIRVSLKDGSLFYKKDEKQNGSGLMLIFWELPSAESLAEEILAKEKENYAHLIIANSDEGSSNPEIYRTLIYQNEKMFIDEGHRLWKALSLDNCHIIGAVNLDTSITSLKRNLFFVILLFWGIAFFNYIAYNLNWLTFISIKYKIAALFYMSFFIALVGFWQLASIYIHNKEEAELVEITNQARKHLSKADMNLRLDSQFFQNRFKSIGNIIFDFDKEENPKLLNQRINTNEIVGVGLMNASSSVYLFEKFNDFYTKDHSTLLKTAIKIALDYKFGSNLAKDEDESMVKLLTNSELGFIYLIKLPEFAHLVNFSNFKMLAYWETRKVGHVTMAASLISSYENTLTSSAQELIHKMHSTKEARPYKVGYVNHSNYDIFPKEFKEIEGFVEFNNILHHTEVPLEFIGKINGEEFFITGIKSKNAENFCFYTAYPLKLYTTQSSRIKALFLAVFVFFTLAAFFSEKLLAAFFIKPIEALTKGVEELSAKNTEHRIAHSQNDELGDLARQFNSILAGLKEMELAQNVQESLLPREIPQLEGYDLAYANRMASAVGGDYFDVFMLDSSNLCAIIGDVSGHGVASALVMAMVKATLYHGFKEKDDLLKLFTDVNTALISYFSKPSTKKMITLFACIINTATGDGIFTNAGHNFPYIVNEKGEVRELMLVHLPLGTTKKVRRLKTLEFRLERQESLLLYTDGIVEIQGDKTEQYGYERFKESFSKLRQLSAQEIIENKVKQYDDWLGKGEPDDDFTIAVIKRN